MTETFETPGMNCGKCAGRITTALKAQNGVTDVAVELAAKRVRVTFDETATSASTLTEALADAGYPTKK